MFRFFFVIPVDLNWILFLQVILKFVFFAIDFMLRGPCVHILLSTHRLILAFLMASAGFVGAISRSFWFLCTHESCLSRSKCP